MRHRMKCNKEYKNWLYKRHLQWSRKCWQSRTADFRFHWRGFSVDESKPVAV